MIDFDRLDKTIHEKARLSIMTLLAGRREWSFQDLKAELGMSDGNLISHLRTLGAAGFVVEQKDESGTRPRTTYSLSREGREAFQRYLEVLESIVRSMRSAS
jgi:DNA-binding HxlR family transcriptional regulator